eukprot:7646902-Alexandrium_andersonii.AAC.1
MEDRIWVRATVVDRYWQQPYKTHGLAEVTTPGRRGEEGRGTDSSGADSTAVAFRGRVYRTEVNELQGKRTLSKEDRLSTAAVALGIDGQRMSCKRCEQQPALEDWHKRHIDIRRGREPSQRLSSSSAPR